MEESITFSDNLVDGRTIEVPISQIMEAFLQSEYHQFQWPFERAITVFLLDYEVDGLKKYGQYGDAEIEALWDHYSKHLATQ